MVVKHRTLDSSHNFAPKVRSNASNSTRSCVLNDIYAYVGARCSSWSYMSSVAGASPRIFFTLHLMVFLGLLVLPGTLIGEARDTLDVSADRS